MSDSIPPTTEGVLFINQSGLGWTHILTFTSGNGSVSIDTETGKVTMENTNLDEASLAFWNAVESAFGLKTHGPMRATDPLSIPQREDDSKPE